MLRTPERCHPLPCAALLTLLSLGPLSTPTVAAPKSAKAPSALALVQRAGAAYREGRHLEAARAYAEALALVPDPIYFTNLVKTLRYADDAEAALRLLQETLARYPADKHPDFKDRAEAQDKVLPELQALTLEQQGDRLAAAQPGDAVAAYHLGNLLRPRARARRKEADLLRKLGRLPEAIATYEQAQRDAAQQPMTPESRSEVDRALLQLRQQVATERGEAQLAASPREAARAFEEAYQFGADPLLLVRAAAAYRAAGDLASAQRALERRQASSQGTALAEVRQQLAEVQALQSGAQAQRLAQAGEPLGAVGVLRVALRDQPLPPLQLALARAYQQSGATAEALEGYRSYLQHGAKEPAALRLEVQTTVGTLSELLRTRGELHRLKNPPFYRKPWFAAVCAVGGIALGAGVTTVVLLTRVSPEPTTELGIKGVNLP